MLHHTCRYDPGKDGLVIYVFGDRQEGQKGYIQEAWDEFKYQFKREKNAVALGLGDYGEWLRPSMRERVYSSLAKDDSARMQLDNLVTKSHDDIIKNMDFLEGKLIGLHEGHHNHTFLHGSSTDQRLASALKTTFLGWTASSRIVVEKPYGEKTHGYVYTVVSTHGNANGRRVGASINWMEQNIVAGFLADQYIMGHGCKNANFVPSERAAIRRVGAPGIDRQLPRCLIVGGFARCYTNGWESDYGERAGFTPQPIGWGIIRLKIIRRKELQLAKGVTAQRGDSRGTYTLAVEQVNVTPDIP